MRPTRSIDLEPATRLYDRAFTRGGDLLTAGVTGDAHALTCWDTRTWSPIWRVPIRTSTRFVLANDEAWVATSDPDRIALYRMRDGANLANFTPPLPVFAGLQGGKLATLLDVPLHRPDGTQVDEGTRLAIFNPQTGTLESHFALHARVAQLVASSDGARVVAIDTAGFSLWDLAGSKLAAFTGRGAQVLFRAGSDELMLAGSSADGEVPVVFDVRTAARVAVLRAPPEAVPPCLFAASSSDGRWLATVHADERDNHWVVDQRVLLWDLQARAWVRTIALDTPDVPGAVSFVRGTLMVIEAGSRLVCWQIALDT